jgi:hypothetical protein
VGGAHNTSQACKPVLVCALGYASLCVSECGVLLQNVHKKQRRQTYIIRVILVYIADDFTASYICALQMIGTQKNKKKKTKKNSKSKHTSSVSF